MHKNIHNKLYTKCYELEKSGISFSDAAIALKKEFDKLGVETLEESSKIGRDWQMYSDILMEIFKTSMSIKLIRAAYINKAPTCTEEYIKESCYRS